MRLFIQPFSNIAVLRPETGNNSNIKARFNFIIHDLSSRQKMSCCTKSVLDLPLPLLYQSLTELKYNYILYLLYNLFVSHQWNHWLSDENSSEFICFIVFPQDLTIETHCSVRTEPSRSASASVRSRLFDRNKIMSKIANPQWNYKIMPPLWDLTHLLPLLCLYRCPMTHVHHPLCIHCECSTPTPWSVLLDGLPPLLLHPFSLCLSVGVPRCAPIPFLAGDCSGNID